MRGTCKYQWEYGMRVVTELSAKENEIKERLDNNLELYFEIAGGGYGRIFPHKTYYSVGISGVAKYFPYPTESILDFLRKNGFFGKYGIHGHWILRDIIKRRATGSRCLIVRETAGFVDTFSGEKLTDVIIPRQFAFEVIAGICLCCENLKDLGIYKSLCKIELVNHLKYSLIFSKIIHRFSDQTFKIFTSNEKMADKYFEVVDFRLNYKDSLQWCLLNFKLM